MLFNQITLTNALIDIGHEAIWPTLLVFSIIDTILIMKPATHKWGIRLLFIIPLMVIAYGIAGIDKIQLTKYFMTYNGVVLGVLIVIFLGIPISYIMLASSFKVSPDVQKWFDRICVNILKIIGCAFLVLFTSGLYVNDKVQNQVTYTARDVPITRYQIKLDEDGTKVKVLAKNGKQATITDDQDSGNTIKVKRSLKYAKPKLVVTQYTAKDLNYLKKIHAEDKVKLYYYVVTYYEPLKDAQNN